MTKDDSVRIPKYSFRSSKIDFGFSVQKSQSFLHVIFRNYQIMYIARDLLKA